jgi:hypothetical protein
MGDSRDLRQTRKPVSLVLGRFGLAVIARNHARNRQKFGILQFTEGWSREQHRQADEAILMHDLQVFSHPAIASSLVAEGENIGLVSQYAINGGGESVMLIRDLVDDAKRCAYDVDLTPARSRDRQLSSMTRTSWACGTTTRIGQQATNL